MEALSPGSSWTLLPQLKSQLTGVTLGNGSSLGVASSENILDDVGHDD